jgi:hypothetical protein
MTNLFVRAGVARLPSMRQRRRRVGGTRPRSPSFQLAMPVLRGAGVDTTMRMITVHSNRTRGRI